MPCLSIHEAWAFLEPEASYLRQCALRILGGCMNFSREDGYEYKPPLEYLVFDLH